jgi:hypothetical protein
MDEFEARCCYDSLSGAAKDLLSSFAFEQTVDRIGGLMQNRFDAARWELLGAGLIKRRSLGWDKDGPLVHPSDHFLTIQGIMVLLVAESTRSTYNPSLVQSMRDRISKEANSIADDALAVSNNIDDHLYWAKVENEIYTRSWTEFCKSTVSQAMHEAEALDELVTCLQLIQQLLEETWYCQTFIPIFRDYDVVLPLSERHSRACGYRTPPKMTKAILSSEDSGGGEEIFEQLKHFRLPMEIRGAFMYVGDAVHCYSGYAERIRIKRKPSRISQRGDRRPNRRLRTDEYLFSGISFGQEYFGKARNTLEAIKSGWTIGFSASSGMRIASSLICSDMKGRQYDPSEKYAGLRSRFVLALIRKGSKSLDWRHSGAGNDAPE